MARLLGKGLKMNEKLNDMDYLELLGEKERVEIALIDTKSIFQKKDYQAKDFEIIKLRKGEE